MKKVVISNMPCCFNAKDKVPSKKFFFLRLSRNATRSAATRKNDMNKKLGGSAYVLLLHNILSAVTRTALNMGETKLK